ncbi:hypothetical protein DL768_005623 [Monosporascus sp. mg162]|nr:hypothetical protein DL768_005623 [Monosporascus sp. mg162]
MPNPQGRWRLLASEENWTAKGVLTYDEPRTRAATNASHDVATIKVSKDVIYETLEGTLSILCIEEIDIIIEHMKTFWVVVMEETRNARTCSDAERGLLRKANSDVRSGFESHLGRFWQQSPIEFLPLEEAVIPPASTAQNPYELRSRDMQAIAISMDRYLEGLSYRLSAVELGDIRQYSVHTPCTTISNTGHGDDEGKGVRRAITAIARTHF